MAEADTLHDVFIDELQDLYDCERQLTRALTKLATTATAPSLRETFESHLQETREQMERLEQVFDLLDEKVRGRHCEGIAGIIEEGNAMIEKHIDSGTMDACLIAVGQRTEHYEIAAYGTLIVWAEAMGQDDVVHLLGQTLDEEQAADKKLSSLAENAINRGALYRVASNGKKSADVGVGLVKLSRKEVGSMTMPGPLCPICRQPGRLLADLRQELHVEYYRCDLCNNVWSCSNLDPHAATPIAPPPVRTER